MPQPIDTLFIDAGGVLVHPSWTRVADALTRHGSPVSAQTLARAEPLATRELDEAALIGMTDDQKRGWIYFNILLRHAGISQSAATDAALADLRTYHDRENLWEHVEPDVVPALQAFHALGLRLVVVSNANGRLRHLFDRLDLTRWFDVLLDSHEWGVEKPDPRLFELALEHSGADRARTVHIGDLYHVDIAGARRAGLRDAVLLDAADLYPEADCLCVKRLSEVADLLAGPTWS